VQTAEISKNADMVSRDALWAEEFRLQPLTKHILPSIVWIRVENKNEI
jgi:hypothetical protein